MTDSTPSLTAQVNRMSLGDDSNKPSSQTQPSELIAAVDDLLEQLSTKFSSVSGDILSKLDQMSKRLDSLEMSIQANTTSSASGGKDDK